MLIKAGSVLIVPRTRQAQDDVASHVADNGQLSLAPEIVTRRTRGQGRQARHRGQHRAPLQAQRGAGGRLERRRRVRPPSSAGQQVVLYLPVRAAARAPVRASAKSQRPRRRAKRARAPRRSRRASAAEPLPACARAVSARRHDVTRAVLVQDDSHGLAVARVRCGQRRPAATVASFHPKGVTMMKTDLPRRRVRRLADGLRRRRPGPVHRHRFRRAAGAALRGRARARAAARSGRPATTNGSGDQLRLGAEASWLPRAQRLRVP